MISYLHIHSKKTVYYYWGNLNEYNFKDIDNSFKRCLHVETIYLDDLQYTYKKHIVNLFQNVLQIILELKYLPPIQLGRFYYNGGYLYHESKNNFLNNIY